MFFSDYHVTLFAEVLNDVIVSVVTTKVKPIFPHIPEDGDMKHGKQAFWSQESYKMEQ